MRARSDEILILSMRQGKKNVLWKTFIKRELVSKSVQNNFGYTQMSKNYEMKKLKIKLTSC